MKTLKILILSFAVLFVINFVFLYSQVAQTIIKTREQYLEEARKYAEGGDNIKADKLMKEMLVIYPNDYKALGYKGMLLMNEGNIHGAKEVFEKAITNEKDYSDGYWFLGVIYRQLGDDQKAEYYLNEAVKHNIESQAHGELASLYYDNKKYDQSIEEAKLYIKYKGNDTRLYRIMGLAYYRKNDYKQAVVAFNNSLQYGDPRDIMNLMDLGKSYEALGDLYHAKETYEIANEWHSYNKEVREALLRVNRKIEEEQ